MIIPISQYPTQAGYRMFSRLLLPKRTRSDVLMYIRAVFQISEKYLRTGVTVAGGVMMLQAYPIVITEVVQSVAYPRQQTSSHLYRTDILSSRFPLDIIIPQTLFQYIHQTLRYVPSADRLPSSARSVSTLPGKSARLIQYPHRFRLIVY